MFKSSFWYHKSVQSVYFLTVKVIEKSYFPLAKAEKNRFFFYLTKLSQSFYLKFTKKKRNWKSQKALELFRETYFQIKVNKSGRRRNPGIFAVTAHLELVFPRSLFFKVYQCIKKVNKNRIVMRKLLFPPRLTMKLKKQTPPRESYTFA